MDPLAQRLVAIAVLISSLALLVGTVSYAYKEVQLAQAAQPALTGSVPAKKK
jgi:hypothetical protein